MFVSTNWMEGLRYEQSLAVMKELSLVHALKGGVEGLRIASAIYAGDLRTLCTFELDVNKEGWDITQLINCRQALAFYSKFEPAEIGIDKTAVAYASFEESEAKCRAFNAEARQARGGVINYTPRFVRLISDARKKISRILGRLPSVEELRIRFGPGATTSIIKRKANPQQKFAETPRCSPELLRSHFFPSIVRDLSTWFDCHAVDWTIDDEGFLTALYDVVEADGVLEFVPKNAKTYRVIVKEPTVNGCLQAATGDWMTKRLRLAGIDISDQTINQRLAREGSIYNELATLDLHAASDSIATELVRMLLPDEWFDWLNAIRSRRVWYNDTLHVLEKFSSMGNGFTFPLETLIFWAITAASCKGCVGAVSAYGDDLICPSDRAEEVVENLGLCGFRVNLGKSFVRGPFRESCGRDYYKGIDIRPFYQKHLVSGMTLFVLHNFYYRHYQIDEAEGVLSYIPESIRLYGPDGFGDGHLLATDWPRERSRKLRRNGWGGVCFDTYRLCPRDFISVYPGDYVTPLYSVYIKDRTPLLKSTFPDFDVSEAQEVRFATDGRPVWPLPGVEGYERISIYTLDLHS